MDMRCRAAMGVRVVLLAALVMPAGCTYLANRGRDAIDIVDIGLTVSKKPGFALYVDFFNITPVAVSHVDGTYLGIGNRQFGALDHKDRAWGALLWGSEQVNTGEFDPDNPHLISPGKVRQMREAGEPLPEQAPRYNVGLVRMVAQDNSPPGPTFLSCRRTIHLGWIGIHNIMRPIDLLDFILGWTTIDIVGDDVSVSADEEPSQ